MLREFDWRQPLSVSNRYLLFAPSCLAYTSLARVYRQDGPSANSGALFLA